MMPDPGLFYSAQNVHLTSREVPADYPVPMPIILSAPPSEIDAGTTVQWNSLFDLYPADGGWTAKFFMRGASQFAGGTGIAGVANLKSFDFKLLPSDTLSLTPGTYFWQIRAYKAPDEYIAVDGVLVVQPTFSGATAGQGTHAERMVAIIEQRIEGRLPADLQQFQIAGRAVVKIPIKELLELRGYYANQVWNERHPGQRRRVRVKFTGASSER